MFSLSWSATYSEPNVQIIASYVQIGKHVMFMAGEDVCDPLLHLQLQLLLFCDGDKDALNS